MPVIATIDVSSNTMHLAVGSLDGGRRLKIFETARNSERLGYDIFKYGVLSRESLDKLIEAIGKF